MKYIIELKDDVQVVQKVGVTENGNAFVMNFYKDQLEELTADYINEHFGDLQDDAYERGHGIGYQKGFEDGKADNDKRCVGCKWEGNGNDHSPCDYCCNCYSNQWQAKQTDDEIKVGDEVEISQSDENGVWVVIKVEKHDDYEAYCAINKDGDIYFEEEQDRVTKTGRHFDIASILKEMQS